MTDVSSGNRAPAWGPPPELQDRIWAAERLQNHAAGLAAVGEAVEAVDLSAEAVEGLWSVARADPRTVPDLAEGLLRHADVLRRAGRASDARVPLRDAGALWPAVDVRDGGSGCACGPEEPGAHCARAHALYVRAGIELAAGEERLALDLLRAAARVLRCLHGPGDEERRPRLLGRLATSLAGQGDLLRGLGAAEDALDTWRCPDREEPVAGASGPRVAERRAPADDLLELHLARGEVLLLLRCPAEAARAFRAALDLVGDRAGDRAAERAADGAVEVRAYVLVRYAEACGLGGSRAEACRAAAESVRLFTALAVADPVRHGPDADHARRLLLELALET